MSERKAVRMIPGGEDRVTIDPNHTPESWAMVLQRFPYSTKVADVAGSGPYGQLYIVSDGAGNDRLYGVTGVDA